MNKFYLLVAASCLLGASCSEESYKQDFSTPGTNRISFSCTAEKSDGSLTIWDSDSQIGLFCEQTGTNNQKLTISAASAGSETALFYTDLEWRSGAHKFALYTPPTMRQTRRQSSGEHSRQPMRKPALQPTTSPATT